MLEIIVIVAILLLLGAAKRRGSSRARMAGYRKLAVDHSQAAGTVNVDDTVSTAFADVLTEQRRITSAVLTWASQGWTAGDGPVVVGLAHSDYTAAEIEECLEAGGTWDEGDKVAQEQGKRLVRIVGTIGDSEEDINDGMPVKTKLNWLLATGDTLQTFIWNRGIQMTTGMTVEVSGHLNSFLA